MKLYPLFLSESWVPIKPIIGRVDFVHALTWFQRLWMVYLNKYKCCSNFEFFLSPFISSNHEIPQGIVESYLFHTISHFFTKIWKVGNFCLLFCLWMLKNHMGMVLSHVQGAEKISSICWRCGCNSSCLWIWAYTW